jgi:DNA-binding NarL/FixJ family response regulator
MKSVRIAIVDDHKLFRRGLVELLDKRDNCQVIWEASNGVEVMKRVLEAAPDIALIDCNMPLMNGEETTRWLRMEYPSVRVLALSMYDDEENIIKMIRAGAVGYMLKDSDPSELGMILDEIMQMGYSYSSTVSQALANNARTEPAVGIALSDREKEFLVHACSEMTYKQIADRMNVAARTVDGYRESLFEKLSCKSRVGLVMFAIRSGMVTL